MRDSGTGKILTTAAEVEAAIASGRLERCVVRRQDLSGFIMENIEIIGATFFEVGLAGLRLRASRLRDSAITGALMRAADFSQCVIENCVFRGCESMEAIFRRADLFSCRFEESPCNNCDFEGAEIVATFFSTSDLYGVRFRDATLVRCRFENRRLGNAVLSRSDFSNAFILDTDFSCADLADADFRNALLIRPNFEDANLSGVRLEGACILLPNLRRVNAGDLERWALNEATVRPAEGILRVLDFLAARSERLVSLVHALLVGYVLSGIRPEAQPVEPVVESAPSPPAQSEPSPVQREVKTPVETSTPAPRQADPVYERFKKIEID